MTKKTRKIIKKGGKSLLENIPFISTINKYGPFIADDIDYNIRQGKKQELIKKYEDDLNDANEAVKRAKENDKKVKEEEKIKLEENKKNLSQRIHNFEIFKFIIQIITNFINFIFRILVKFIDFFYKFIGQIGSGSNNFFNSIIKLFNIGNGVIIKTIVLIIIILLIFFGVNGFFGGGGTSSNNNILSKERNLNSFIISTKQPDLKIGGFEFSFSNVLNNIIPDHLKFSFNNFRNSLNKSIGNDLLEKSGSPRIEETSGKNDGIYHIKFEQEPNKTYTILKPKPIEIDTQTIINSLPDSDFNKLPAKIKEKYLYQNIKYTLNASKDEDKNGKKKWLYDVNNIEILLNGSNIELKKLPQYKNPFENTDISNEIKFNSVKAIIFDDTDNSSSVLLDKMFNYKEDKYEYPKNYVNDFENKYKLNQIK